MRRLDEPSHLDLRCLTFSLYKIYKKNLQRNDKCRLKFAAEKLSLCTLRVSTEPLNMHHVSIFIIAYPQKLEMFAGNKKPGTSTALGDSSEVKSRYLSPAMSPLYRPLGAGRFK